MQPARGQRFAKDGFPGRDRPGLEDAVPQQGAERIEGGIGQIVVEGVIELAESLPPRDLRAGAAPGEVPQGLAEGALPLRQHGETGCSRLGLLRAAAVASGQPMLQQRRPEKPTDRGRGIYSMAGKPCRIGAGLQPPVEPEIIGRRGGSRAIERPGHDPRGEIAQLGRAVEPFGGPGGIPERHQRVVMAAAEVDRTQQPIAAHRHRPPGMVWLCLGILL